MSGARGYEVVIVGAGVAGASLAYFLAEGGLGDVLLLEREEQLAVHSTGRSAATLSQLDRVQTLMELIVASAPFFQSPPPGFAEHRFSTRSVSSRSSARTRGARWCCGSRR